MGHSSSEITLKHYSLMRQGADTMIADEIMEGYIKIETATKTKIVFNGNQSLKK